MTSPTTRRWPDFLAGPTALLLPMAFSPALAAPDWSPRAALVLVVAGSGVPLATRLALAERRPEPRVLLAFLIFASASAASADDRTTTLFGLYGWGTGLLFMMGLVGAWGIGQHLSETGRSDVVRALLAAGIINSGLALLQVVLDLTPFSLSGFEGRSTGLYGNPVYLAVLLAGCFSLAARRWREQRPKRWLTLAAAAVIAAGVQASGSRVALVIVVVSALAVAVSAGRSGAGFVATIGAALIATSLLASVAGASTGAERLTSSDGGGGIVARAETWLSVRHAVAADPILGEGPGRFRAATSPFRSEALARAEGPDKLYVDAHNLFVEWAATVGLPALVLMVLFLVLAFRRGRGPLLWFAAALLAMHLVSPQTVGTTPLLFLALGAAGPRTAGDPARAVSATAAVGFAAAVVAASFLLRGDAQLFELRSDLALEEIPRAGEGLPAWPETAALQATAYLFQGADRRDERLYGRAITAYAEAVRRDPSDPRRWIDLADAEASLGDPCRAEAAAAQGLRRNPWSTRALVLLSRRAIERGQTDLADGYLARAERVQASKTIDDLRSEIDVVRAARRGGGPKPSPSSECAVGR